MIHNGRPTSILRGSEIKRITIGEYKRGSINEVPAVRDVALSLSLFGACLFAQGLNTTASKDDWEEINFEFNSPVLTDGYPSLLRLAEMLQQNTWLQGEAGGSRRCYRVNSL